MEPRKRGPVPIEPTPNIIAQLGQIPDQELADQAGVSLTTIWRWRQARGIGATTRKWDKAAIARTVQQLRDLKAATPGISLAQAAEQLEIPYNTASEISAEAEPVIEWPRPGRPRGERARQRAHKVAELRAGDSPAPFSEIGRKLRITRQAAHSLSQAE